MKQKTREEIFDDLRVLPSNFGPHRGATLNARITGPCGDTMEFWLTVVDGRLARVTYTTDGCGHSNLCGTMCARLAQGQMVAEAQRLMQADVITAIGDLPEASTHCALLAVNTLRAALDAGGGAAP